MKLFNDLKRYSQWENVLTTAVDRILVFMSLCAPPALISSLSRARDAGMQPEMWMHVILATIFIAISMFRKRLHVNIKILAILIPTLCISIAGLYTWGFIGVGLAWGLLGAILASLLFGQRIGMVYNLLLLGLLCGCAYLFVNGIKTPPISPSDYIKNLSGWATVIFGAAVPLIVVTVVIGSMYDTAKSLMIKLEEQRKQITILAERDPLTDIYNVRVLHDRLRHALEHSHRSNTPLYLINIDLDDFKMLNDTYGHSAGDEALRVVAQRLSSAMRSVDTVARVGGDEFLILVEHVDGSESLERIEERLSNLLSKPFTYDGETISLKASIGYTCHQPNNEPNAVSLDELLKLADREMYRAKQANTEI